MKRNWEMDELIEHFTIMPSEMRLIENKTGETRLGFAVLLKFFQHEARFPSQKYEVPKAVIAYIAKQIYTEPALYAQYDWAGRSITYHRTQIREFFGFREDTTQDAQDITDWLCKNVLYHDQEFEHVKDMVYKRFRELKIVPPTPERIERLIRSAVSTFEEQFFKATYEKIPNASLAKLDALIESISSLDEEKDEPTGENGDAGYVTGEDAKREFGLQVDLP
ncbi:DUF4158 domain-containing protein [Desulfosporosinus sp. SB140]|uniref:DUF4158 domain-containing protein n=1 Tax=Desulfosporosinus paludis TaxID=3115649 RepID=UPI00388E0708